MTVPLTEDPGTTAASIRRLTMTSLPRRSLPACRKRWIVAAAMSLMTGAALAQSVLSLGVPRSPLSLPLFIAESEGMFEDAGLRVNIAECPTGQRCMKMVLEGTADVATVGDTPIVFNSFGSSDFVVIGTIASAPGDLKLIVRRDSGISSPAGLAGHKIGIVSGSTSQYFLDSFLLTHGIDPALVTTLPMQPDAMLDALQSRRVDGVSVWEPYGYRITGAMRSGVLLLPSEGIYSVTFNLVAHRRMVGGRDADLSRLLRAVEQAERFIQAQPERAKAILRRRLGVDDAFVQWVWPQQLFRLSLDQSLLKTLESEARWALREGHVSARTAPNFLSLFHRAPLTAVNPTAVGISR